MTISNQTFNPPAVTSQYTICPIPFHIDTYRGCVYNCAYCFARDIVNFTRRKRGTAYTILTLNDPGRFRSWMQANYGKATNYNKAARTALNLRIPLKIGANSDPCPPDELKHRVTESFLRILNLYNYPVQIQTKNPKILYSVLEKLGAGLNLVISVTVISLDSEWTRKVERGAPSPEDRLYWIQRITNDLGYPVMVKVQPAIYPMILEELPALIEAVKEAGCWAFNTEGLKIRVNMPEEEQRLWRKTLGNVRSEYKQKYGHIETSDYVLRDEYKQEYIELAERLGAEYGMKYFSADNTPLGSGDGSECCGTEKLSDYHEFTYNLRSRAFGKFETDALTRCYLNFGRSPKPDKTIQELVDRLL